MKQIIGLILLASPFVVMAVGCFKTGGWHCFCVVFGSSAAIIAVILIGVYLLNS